MNSYEKVSDLIIQWVEDNNLLYGIEKLSSGIIWGYLTSQDYELRIYIFRPRKFRLGLNRWLIKICIARIMSVENFYLDDPEVFPKMLKFIYESS